MKKRAAVASTTAVRDSVVVRQLWLVAVSCRDKKLYVPSWRGLQRERKQGKSTPGYRVRFGKMHSHLLLASGRRSTTTTTVAEMYFPGKQFILKSGLILIGVLPCSTRTKTLHGQDELEVVAAEAERSPAQQLEQAIKGRGKLFS